MANNTKSTIIAAGLAMFSMFFGAGNIAFPLALGKIAQDHNFFAIIGMLTTAVGVPFLGLIAMTLFDGNYKSFFRRIGDAPGFLLAAVIMSLIGPFGATPRCITLSYSTAQTFLPEISLPVFSAISCVIIFLFTMRRNTIVELLGYVLTPVLLVSLTIIIIMGLLTGSDQPMADHSKWALFFKGLNDGYQTMDLLGAFFFSSVIIASLKSTLLPEQTNPKKLIAIALQASSIGAALLAVIYVGFSYVASFHSEALGNSAPDALISKISILILGPYAAIIACVAVAFACLTTAIALASVFAEFIHADITLGKIGYIPSLIATLVVTYFVSTLHFTGIAAFLEPILQVCYPALIMLSLLNIAYKLYNFRPVKLPVAIVFLFSFAAYFWT